MMPKALGQESKEWGAADYDSALLLCLIIAPPIWRQKPGDKSFFQRLPFGIHTARFRAVATRSTGPADAIFRGA